MSPEKEKQQRSEHASKGSAASRRSDASQTKAENKSARSKSEGKESRLPAGKSARTTDHDAIRQWVEARGGSPATVKATEKGDDPGLLRINFPGYSGEGRLENISWDEFFKKFDEKNLAFLYQDETRGGETSRFWKFVSREGEDKGKSKSKQS